MYQMSQSYGLNTQKSSQYSPLETIAGSYSSGNIAYAVSSMPAHSNYHADMFVPASKPFHYTTQSTSKAYQSSNTNYQFFNTQAEYHFQPDNFLKPGKEGIFVGKAEEIREHIESAFEAIFHQSFPADIKISVCNAAQFRTIAPNPQTIGLSINRRSQGLLSEIFVLNDSLGRVMLTIGHELGHVLTPTLDDAHDEEAKAYSFSLAWMKAIQEFDLAGLADAIVTENPAHNGLHNVAFAFVEKLLLQGQKAWEIYVGLIERMIMVKEERMGF